MVEIKPNESFGNWLRRQRKALDLTQLDVAVLAGCSTDTIRKLESGERKPSRDMAKALLVTLKVPESEMPAIIKLARVGADEEKVQGNTPALAAASLQESVTTTSSSRTLHLPVQRSTFVGRNGEISKIESLLMRTDTNVVTITGSPGIGKTRLAIQAATSLEAYFPDGVYFVALANVLQHDEILPAVARALSVNMAREGQVIDILKDELAGRRLLLVLDNFEHVIEGRLAISDLAASCPSLKLLVTSRRLLKIYGECEYRVPSLSVPGPLVAINAATALNYEAPKLFMERAALSDSSFQLTDENAPIIVEICRRVDALPLAIELAASRSRVLGPRAILARLSSKLKLLNMGGQDLTPRQQTLRGAIAWSYELLDEREAALFRCFSVFVNGAGLDAIHSVCLGEHDKAGMHHLLGDSAEWFDALDCAATLLDVSLLERMDDKDGEPRFRMLATVREYAEEMLEARGEADAARIRLARYYQDLVEDAEPRLIGSERDVCLQQLDLEYDNILYVLTKGERHPHLALRITGALGWYWYFKGLFSEGRQWLKTTIGWAGASLDSAEMAKALRAAAWLANNQADLPTARTLAEMSVQIYSKLEAQRDLGLALSILGITVVLQAQVEMGYDLLEKSVSLLRQSDDPWALAFGLSCLADASTWQANYENALHLYEESLSLYQRLGDRWGISEELRSLGGILLQNGKYEEALARLEHSLSIEPELGSKRNRALTLYNIGYALFSLEMREQALASYKDALAIFRDLKMTRAACGALRHLIYLMQSSGNIKSAIELCREYEAYQKSLANNLSSLLYLRAVTCLAVSSSAKAQASRLLAFIELEQRASESTLASLDRKYFSDCYTTVKNSLQPSEWTEAEANAATLNIEKAIDYASYLLTICSLSV